MSVEHVDTKSQIWPQTVEALCQLQLTLENIFAQNEDGKFCPLSQQSAQGIYLVKDSMRRGNDYSNHTATGPLGLHTARLME